MVSQEKFVSLLEFGHEPLEERVFPFEPVFEDDFIA
jgi:hypothetical protein